MIRKTALLTGIAGLMLTAAPAAFAQDAAPAPTPSHSPGSRRRPPPPSPAP
jgi:hypothetical protein